MGITNTKNWECICDGCGDVETGLAVYKPDFIDILKNNGWKITENGNKALCPNCCYKAISEV